MNCGQLVGERALRQDRFWLPFAPLLGGVEAAGSRDPMVSAAVKARALALSCLG